MNHIPMSVNCSTCDGTAEAVSWGSTFATCYRCNDCPAGGHIARTDRGSLVKQGGVFEVLKNYQSRQQEVPV